jgi:GxxExxY protein
LQDRKRQDMQDSVAQHIHSNLTETILEGLKIEAEKRFEVVFRGRKIGLYVADLVVEESLIVELKCCDGLLGEHQAQLINYLKVSGILVGLLVNFGKRKVEYKRLPHPDYHVACDHANLDFLS